MEGLLAWFQKFQPTGGFVSSLKWTDCCRKINHTIATRLDILIWEEMES